MNHIHFKHHVVVHEVGQCPGVGCDTTHLGGCEKHILRAFFFKKAAHTLLVGQIKLGVSACDDVVIPLAFQFPYDGRPNHSAMSGHIYLSVFFHVCINK